MNLQTQTLLHVLEHSQSCAVTSWLHCVPQLLREGPVLRVHQCTLFTGRSNLKCKQRACLVGRSSVYIPSAHVEAIWVDLGL